MVSLTQSVASGSQMSSSRPTIGIPASATTVEQVSRYFRGVEKAGGRPRCLRPPDLETGSSPLESVQGLLLTGGADIHPSYYGGSLEVPNLVLDQARDASEFALVKGALERDLPILGICRGMQVINVALGGGLLPDIPGHCTAGRESAYHGIYIHKESRLANILGLSGLVRVNSRHHQGVMAGLLAPELIATAYQPEDLLIEGLESSKYRWLLGVQCHPEREDEVPPEFQKLFRALVEAAQKG